MGNSTELSFLTVPRLLLVRDAKEMRGVCDVLEVADIWVIRKQSKELNAT